MQQQALDTSYAWSKLTILMWRVSGVCVQMGPGPNGVGMTLYNLTCGAWDIYNSVFTTQPAVAQRLPFPDGAPQIAAATKAGPLVQSVRDCDSLQVRHKLELSGSRAAVKKAG